MKIMINACLLLFGLGLFFTTRSGEFKAACIEIDITPDKPVWLSGFGSRDKPSTGVHDPLFLKVLCMSDGLTYFYLISSDIVNAPYDEQFVSKLEQEGIPKRQVMWTATHTHSGPSFRKENDGYKENIQNICIQAMIKARSRLIPAKIGYTSSIALANMNRRVQYPDRFFLGKNPNGVMDRELGVIKILDENDTLISLVVNYAMHGTSLYGKNYETSADAMGVVTEYVKNKLNAPVMYVNGACGNLDPIYAYRDTFQQENHFDINAFQFLLGRAVLTAQQMVTNATADVSLHTGLKTISLPRDTTKNPRNPQDSGENIQVDVQFLGINNLLLFSAPLELFNDVAMHIKDHSPFDETFYFGYCNGSKGYLTTKKAFLDGGYEIRVTPYTPQAEKQFCEGVMAYVNTLYEDWSNKSQAK
jgi:hypothetical protein